MALSRHKLHDPDTRPPSILVSDEDAGPGVYRVTWQMAKDGAIEVRDVAAETTRTAIAAVCDGRRPAWAYTALRKHWREVRT